MTESPQSSPERNQNPKKGKLVGAMTGLSLLTGVGGVVYWYGQNFVSKQLSPLVSKTLTELLNRPVQIGEVTGISLNHLEFGTSKILPTKNDPDQITIPKITVNFNPLEAIFRRQVNLEVTAVRPEVLLQQAANGNWLATPPNLPQPGGKESPIKIGLKTLQIEDADITIRARDLQKNLNPPVQVKVTNGNLQLTDFSGSSKLDYNLTGNLSQGDLQIRGQTNLNNFTTAINLVSDNLAVKEVAKLVPLPLTIKSGNLKTDLQLDYNPTKPIQLTGTAEVNKVTAQLKEIPQPVTNVQGSFKFAGSSIKLTDGVTAEFGNIKAKTTGNVDLVKGYQLNLQTEPFSIPDSLKTLKIQAPSLVLKGQAKAQVQLTGELEKPKIDLQMESTKEAIKIDKISLAKFKLKASFKDSHLKLQQLEAVPTIGGIIQGTGQATLAPTNQSNFSLNFTAKQIPADSIARIYALNLPTKIGPVQGQGQIKGNLAKIDTVKLTGNLQTSVAEGTVNLNNIQYQTKTGIWQTDVKAEKIQLAAFNLPITQGTAKANLQVKGAFSRNLAQTLEVKGNASLALPGGKVNVPNIRAKNGHLVANIETNNLQIAGLVPSLPPQIKGSLKSNLSVSASLEKPKETLKVQGSAALALPEGQVKLNQISLDQGRWKTQIKAENIALTPFVPKIPGYLNSELNLTGYLDDPLKTIRGTGSAFLDSRVGQVRVNHINLAGSNFQAQANLQNIKLATFSPELRGKLNGYVQLQGNLAKLTPQGIQAQGDLNFSQGISLIEHPLDTRFSWQGKRLELQRVTAEGLNVKGWLDIDAEKLNQGISALREVSLDIVAKNLNLKNLSASLPSTHYQIPPFQGWLDFTGGVRGTLKKPYIEGNIALQRGLVGPLTLDPVLEGTVRVNPKAGVNLKLSGKRDKIALALDSNYQLQAVDLQLELVKLTGRKQQSQIDLQVNHLSLAWLKELIPYSPIALDPNIKAIALDGDFSGNFKIDLGKQELITDHLQITDPIFGAIKGKSFTADVSFINGDLTLSKGLFKINQTEYQLDGLLQTKKDLAFQANVKIKQGQIQDVLQTLRVFELSDFSHLLNPPKFAKANELFKQDQATNQPLFNLGRVDVPIIYQLRRYSEIRTLYNLQQEKNKLASFLPELSKLKGNFDAAVSVSGSLKQQINAQFDFNGQDWQWDHINIKEVVAKGQFDKGNLQLEPVRIQVEDSLVSFVGNLNNNKPTGQLQIEKIPLSLLDNFVQLPANLTIGGSLNGKFILAGTSDNPQVTGEMNILNPNINQMPLESTEGTFTYNNSRLDFNANSVLASGTPPLTLQGSLPYRLPFAKKMPDSKEFALNVNVRDKGLMILNILTREQLRWLSGHGQVDLSVKGSLNSKQKISDLTAEGAIELKDGTIAAEYIPDAPLTEINGKINLNIDQIDVQELTAKLSGSSVKVAGSLPLKKRKIVVSKPLTADFEGLAFNIKGLYKGGLQGELIVSGTALNPRLGGNINFSDGEIFLGSLVGSQGSKVNPGTEPSSAGAALEFNQLELNLKNNIQLTQSPILSFNAIGGLTLNGTLEQPRPKGKIQLKNGLINLFATQFRLAGGDKNTATFSPVRGLDPYLNISLFTSVSETQRSLVRADPLSSEVNNTFNANADSFQTIRIQAKVDGYASDLQQSIRLTSSPSRSTNEIVALLGGDFINGASDPTIGLASFASSALFGNFQESLRSTLGLSEFRVSPTPLINPKDRTNGSQIGIVGEVGIDLSPSLFFSAQQILNVDRPVQYGLRYTINDNFSFRGSSNFTDETLGVLEYKIRF